MKAPRLSKVVGVMGHVWAAIAVAWLVMGIFFTAPPLAYFAYLISAVSFAAATRSWYLSHELD